ncbi:thioesterase II family protein [Psychromonas sp. Urea-02u-13]|uniref:thioesterase II family protein n=1 Tax=Psychromonas sp. Urea-02u-13 TaxID=2058326 RepID=UPI000C31FABC|nr:alpha/beta fold hydrolase [Psychromonas sp. Urea-02u-13]PKG40098.1 thioesterase [Psychromonas sp. Urea-02u-13]
MSNLITLSAPSEGQAYHTHFVLCPFAGGGISAFRTWRKLDLADSKVSLVAYPGRGSRIEEPKVNDIHTLAKDLIQTLIDSGETMKNVVLIGHSMGAQIAYEACKYLVSQGSFPKGLVISGCQAPHIKSRRTISHYDDNSFVEQLISIGGCDPSFGQQPEWWPAFLLILRADFEATERYFFRSKPKTNALIKVPTLLVSGNHDEEAYFDEVNQWECWLSCVIDHKTLAGDHFYITANPQQFMACLEPFHASDMRWTV